MTKSEQVLKCSKKNAASKILAYELIDMIIMETGNYMLAIRLKQHNVAKKLLEKIYITARNINHLEDNGLELLTYIHSDKCQYNYDIDIIGIIDTAVETGCLNVVKYLYSIGIEPTYCTVEIAIANNDLNMVKFMCRVIKNPTNKILEYFVSNQCFSSIEYLVNIHGLKILHSEEFDDFTHRGYFDFIKWSYEKYSFKPSIYVMNRACMYNHLDVVEYLYGIGFKVNNTTMDYAIYGGHLEIVKYLHKTCGIKPNNNNLLCIKNYRNKNPKSVNYDIVYRYLINATSKTG
jgi:hypothetical protein